VFAGCSAGAVAPPRTRHWATTRLIMPEATGLTTGTGDKSAATACRYRL